MAFRSALDVLATVEPRIAAAIAAELADQRGSLKLIAVNLFGAQHAYVQPHSGIDANLVAFRAVLAARVEAPVLRDSRARCRVEPGVTTRVAARAAELVDAHPLYPEVDLSS